MLSVWALFEIYAHETVEERLMEKTKKRQLPILHRRETDIHTRTFACAEWEKRERERERERETKRDKERRPCEIEMVMDFQEQAESDALLI